MTTVLKLGGSVITDKTTSETVATEQLTDLAESIGDVLVAENNRTTTALSNLVIVHGGGSFGHPHAAEHSVSRTDGTRDAMAVRDIASAMERLNDAVVRSLADAGVPAVPVHPFSSGYRNEDDTLTLCNGQLAAMLAEEFVPVLHGDILVQRGVGGTIVSGDELVTHIATHLDADSIGLCTTVPGVLDESGNVISEISDFESFASVLGESDMTDVTGGMAAKVKALLKLNAPAHIFSPDEFTDFLAGRDVGTRISR